MDQDPHSTKPAAAPLAQVIAHPGPAAATARTTNGISALERVRDRLIGAFARQGAQSVRQSIKELLKRPASREELSPSERFMLRNILRFSKLRVDAIMVPRADIVAIENSASLGELLITFRSAEHSRLPVYRETLDDPRGMVHIKDLLTWITDRAVARPADGDPGDPGVPARASPEVHFGAVDMTATIGDAAIARDILFVPGSMRGADLLVKMQTTRVHMAIVIDEYGGTDGLVTIEDLVEQIVGEIEDEHDVLEGPLIRRESETSLVAEARAPIEDLEQLLGIELTDEREDDVDTLGGLVLSRAGRVPVRGEVLHHPGGVDFEILDSDLRRIKRLRVVVAGPGTDARGRERGTAVPAGGSAGA